MISWHLLRGPLVFFKNPARLSRIMSVVWLMDKIATWNITYLFLEAINGDLFFTVLHFQFVTSSSQISLITVSSGDPWLENEWQWVGHRNLSKAKGKPQVHSPLLIAWFHMNIIVPVLSTIIPKQILICGPPGSFIWTLWMIMILEKLFLIFLKLHNRWMRAFLR